MAVYLIHPLFLSLLAKTPLAAHPGIIAVVAFLLALGLGEAIRKSGLSRQLL